MSVEMVRLGDVAKVVSGATPKTANAAFWDGEIFWATPKDLSDLKEKVISATSRKITEQGLKSCSSELLPVGSVLLSSRAPIGYTAVTTVPMATNQGFKSLIPQKNKLDASYLHYCLRANKEKLNSLGRGATFKEISKGIVENFVIPLPPLERQREIAAVLDKVDELRAKRRQSISKLEELLQSTFLEMFGDPVENPKGWEVKKLGDLLIESPKNGAYFPAEQYTQSDGVEMVHMSDAFSGLVERGKLRRVLVESKIIQKYSISDSDLLIARRSLNYEGAARACLIPTDAEPLIFESSLIKIIPNQNIIKTEYLFYYLNNSAVRKSKVQKYITGATISGISQGSLIEIEILIPPINKQEEFFRFTEKLKAMMVGQQTHLQYLDTLYASLQAQFFGAGA